jgi:hypothetical protein
MNFLKNSVYTTNVLLGRWHAKDGSLAFTIVVCDNSKELDVRKATSPDAWTSQNLNPDCAVFRHFGQNISPNLRFTGLI